MAWVIQVAVFLLVAAFALIIGAAAAIIAGISWVVNWYKTRDKPVSQAHYSDRR